jgi:hypothetical protein
MILLASATGMPAPQIAEVVRSDESHVRRVIYSLNKEGVDSLDPEYRGGRPKKADAHRAPSSGLDRARPPRQPGRPVNALVARQAAPIDWPGWAWAFPRKRCAKSSTGPPSLASAPAPGSGAPTPTFAAKAERILTLRRARPEDGVVVCLDEMGRSSCSPTRALAGRRAVPRLLPWRGGERPHRRTGTCCSATRA